MFVGVNVPKVTGFEQDLISLPLSLEGFVDLVLQFEDHHLLSKCTKVAFVSIEEHGVRTKSSSLM